MTEFLSARLEGLSMAQQNGASPYEEIFDSAYKKFWLWWLRTQNIM